MCTARAVSLLLILLLGVVGCGREEDGEGPATGARPHAPTTTAADATQSGSGWVTEEEMRAWQEQHETDGLWVVDYFLPPDWECYVTRRNDLVPRWKLLSRREEDLAPAEFVRKALAALEGAVPDGLSNALERVPLRVLRVHFERETVYLDFDPGIYGTNSMGTCGGSAMAVQFIAAVRHYFPAAGQACVLVEGTPSGREGEALVFHDSVACPMRLDG
jgi:hypothetical protein